MPCLPVTRIITLGGGSAPVSTTLQGPRSRPLLHRVSSLFHNIVTIRQSVSRRGLTGRGLRLVKLYCSGSLCLGSTQPECSMTKLSQYASYMALAAALFIGFAVTVQVGLQF